MLNICLHFSYKGVDFSYEKDWGKTLEKVSDRHYPNVVLLLIIIYLVMSFIIL